MTLSAIFYPCHFVSTILSIPFCPITFCPCTILSIPFCPIPFCPYTVARLDVANVSETVTFQERHLPHDHGISVTPSGRLPSSLVRPSGSFLEGMFALLSDRHTISAASIWFEMGGGRGSGSKNFDCLGRFFQAISQRRNRFLGQIPEKCQFFSGNFTKNFDLLRQIPKNFGLF